MVATPSTAARSRYRPSRRLRVTVLAGGPGSEREVSLASGAAVAAALTRLGHHVRVADISPNDLTALDDPGDVVFPALHGTFGEDGQVQALMEARGIRFVGCDAAASRIAIDKVQSKRMAEQLGIRTPYYQVVSRQQPACTQKPPVVIKPPCEGSSVGVVIAQTAAELADAIAAGLAEYEALLVEQYIAGREATVGIVGQETLPIICIRPADGFYDYGAKYDADDTEYLFDALPAGIEQKLAADSLRLFDRIGGRHLARVDWIAGDDGRGWLLEINTLPGFTAHSLLPKAAARIGIDFDELVGRLVDMVMEDT